MQLFTTGSYDITINYYHRMKMNHNYFLQKITYPYKVSITYGVFCYDIPITQFINNYEIRHRKDMPDITGFIIKIYIDSFAIKLVEPIINGNYRNKEIDYFKINR